MEELASTAKLDQQIFEDARKKAARIQKNADSVVAEQKTQWDGKLREALIKEEEQFSSRFGEYKF